MSKENKNNTLETRMLTPWVYFRVFDRELIFFFVGYDVREREGGGVFQYSNLVEEKRAPTSLFILVFFVTCVHSSLFPSGKRTERRSKKKRSKCRFTPALPPGELPWVFKIHMKDFLVDYY